MVGFYLCPEGEGPFSTNTHRTWYIHRHDLIISWDGMAIVAIFWPGKEYIAVSCRWEFLKMHIGLLSFMGKEMPARALVAA